jgi:hypothetical protein
MNSQDIRTRSRVFGTDTYASSRPCTYNEHRPHQGIANARPVRPLPPPITDPDQISDLEIRRHQRLGGILHEYKHAA